MIADGPPLAYPLVRRMLQRSGDLPMAELAEYEWAYQRLLLQSKDVAEGFRSFVEKDRPSSKAGNWPGRDGRLVREFGLWLRAQLKSDLRENTDE